MGDRDFTITVPYRSTPSREPLFQALSGWYKENLDVDVCAFDAPQVIDDVSKHLRFFNLAAARNLCVKESATRIVVINDADTIPDKNALLQAIQYVSSTGETCLPFSRYNIVPYLATREFLQGQPIDQRRYKVHDPAFGGIIVTTKTMWNQHNGQDERMFGWGYEDTAWQIAHETLIGKIHRMDGDVYALSHDLAERGINIQNNSTHFKKYLDAQGDVEKMTALVAGNRLKSG